MEKVFKKNHVYDINSPLGKHVCIVADEEHAVLCPIRIKRPQYQGNGEVKGGYHISVSSPIVYATEFDDNGTIKPVLKGRISRGEYIKHDSDQDEHKEPTGDGAL